MALLGSRMYTAFLLLLAFYFTNLQMYTQTCATRLTLYNIFKSIQDIIQCQTNPSITVWT